MIRKETQQSIADWAKKTFGPANNHTVLVDRAMNEMTELKEAVRSNNTIEIGKETADVVILLYRILELNGLDLNAELNAKMLENRTRKWLAKGDGTGSHIE